MKVSKNADVWSIGCSLAQVPRADNMSCSWLCNEVKWPGEVTGQGAVCEVLLDRKDRLCVVMAGQMYVVKRDGRSQERMVLEVKFDNITARIRNLCDGLDPRFIDPVPVTQKVVEGFYNGITTAQIDTLAAETCAYMSQKHPDFSTLAARIAVSNLHKMNTSDSFYETCKILFNYIDPQERPAALLSKENCTPGGCCQDVFEFVEQNAKELDGAIEYDRDLGYDYFGFKTLEKSYLLRVHGKIVERPQHMIMRAACGIHCGDLAATLETYDLMSRKFFTHATPTLFNAGTPHPQMSSCFLLKMQGDSIDGIYDTLKQCAVISKSAGGIGVAVSNIRASGSYIRGTNGHSNGLVPMLRNFNETARYVDQGGGKRKGALAVYLEPWHADVFEFLELRKNHGKEEQRARLAGESSGDVADLFYGLWVPDLFMERVKADADWTLFCPNESYDEETGKGKLLLGGLMDLWGEDFNKLYSSLEAAGKGRKTVKAQHLWSRILEAQMETGTPYMLYKDHANRKSNQQNLGTIHCSNLCTAPMPTASTAQILGNNESFEPYTQNLYVRRVLSGEFVQARVNRHLLKDLISQGLWTEDPGELYKTVWEIKQKVVIDMAADRGPYIDQSQSNIHMTDATAAKITSMHFHGWQRGLKTGMLLGAALGAALEL
eukprot:Skav222209  [mRNA]  locus=scaffold552:32351:50489:+ [translate_table: standard]